MIKSKAIQAWVDRNQNKFKGQSERTHLINFLNENFPKKNSINFNYEQCVEKASKWAEINDLKVKNEKDAGLTELIMTFPDGMKIVKLVDAQSKIWEGTQMGHCVGDKRYHNNQGIYSLRDKFSIPHCTVSVRPNGVDQIQGNSNLRVNEKYAPYIFDFLNQKNISGSDRSISNLGYTKIAIKEASVIKKVFLNAKFKTHDKKTFLYTGNVLKLKKSIDNYEVTRPLKKKLDEIKKEFETLQDVMGFERFSRIVNLGIKTVNLGVMNLLVNVTHMGLNLVKKHYLSDMPTIIKTAQNKPVLQKFLDSVTEEARGAAVASYFEPEWTMLLKQDLDYAISLYKNRSQSTEEKVFGVYIPEQLVKGGRLDLAMAIIKSSIDGKELFYAYQLKMLADLKNVTLSKYLIDMVMDPEMKIDHISTDRFTKTEVMSQELVKTIFEGNLTQMEIVDYAVERFPEMDFSSVFNTTANYELEVVKSIVDRKLININALPQLSASNFKSGVAQYLLSKGYDLTKKNSEGYLKTLSSIDGLTEYTNLVKETYQDQLENNLSETLERVSREQNIPLETVRSVLKGLGDQVLIIK